MRYTLEFIKKEFEKEGYTLLEKEYRNNTQNLNCICKNGHNTTITWMSFQHGSRCKYCSKTIKKTLEFIKKEFEKEGYTLLSTEYENALIPLNYICNNEHKHRITWASWKNGSRCAICKKKKKHTIEEVKAEFAKEGYTVLSDDYVNSLSRLKVMCPKGHITSTLTWGSWISGIRCFKCNPAYPKTVESVREELAKEGYTLLSSEYKNNKSNLEFRCPKGHVQTFTWNTWQKQNTRCKTCNNTHHYSKDEHDLGDFLESIGIKIYRNNRSLIPPKELDIVIPSKKLAIEYCGLYWHSEDVNRNNKLIHLHKLNECDNIEYTLLTIFEDEWINKSEIVKNRLQYMLEVKSVKNITDFVIKPVNTLLKNKFLKEFHIKGPCVSDIALGAFYENKLIGIMLFTLLYNKRFKISNFTANFEFNEELVSKALLEFFSYNYKPESLSFYADRRWAESCLFNKLGFEFIHNLEPKLWYTKNLKRSLDKEDFSSKVCYRLYDCGYSKYIKEF